MKKNLFLTLILMIVMAFSVPAFAEDNMYVVKDGVNVYKKKDTHGKVLWSLDAGDQLTVDLEESTEKWVAVPLTNTDGYGWVRRKNLSFVMPSDVCDHQWTDWEITEEPTCTREGMRVRNCPICGLGEADVIPRKDHSYGPWTITVMPTCTSEGEQMHECTVCGAKEYMSIPRNPHNYTDWTVTKQPTCTSEGERVRTCMICGTQDREVLEKLPHSFGEWTTVKEPTCTEEGDRVHTCAVCGYEEHEAIGMLPHDLEEKILVEATDHSAGKRASVCKNCGYTTEEESFDPEGTLRRGDRSDEVREMQQLLEDQHYSSGYGADGIFGGGTEQALIAFQTDHGLTADGVCWPQTLKELQHEFGPWEVTQEPTRDTAGEHVRKCTKCGFEQHETIDPSPLLERGRSAEDVRAAQIMLTDLGFDPGTADGIYGQRLDDAYSAFAEKNELDFEPGKLLPSQLDELVNQWIAAVPEDQWAGLDNAEAADLELTVTPDGEDAGDNDIYTYNWTLTNKGEDEYIFTALLLNFGAEPDFRDGNYAVVLDRALLQAEGGNSVSGTITVDRAWGGGAMSFCALGVSEKTGAKHLSNQSETF